LYSLSFVFCSFDHRIVIFVMSRRMAVLVGSVWAFAAAAQAAVPEIRADGADLVLSASEGSVLVEVADGNRVSQFELVTSAQMSSVELRVDDAQAAIDQITSAYDARLLKLETALDAATTIISNLQDQLNGKGV
jgi:hypothetical protein